MFNTVEFSRLLWQGRRKKRILRRTDLLGEFVQINNAEIRVLVTQEAGAGQQTLVVIPDPPNVIEHYLPLIAEFSPHVRVVVFELPGFGHSYPNAGFRFDIASQTIAFETLFSYLNIRNAVLDVSCLGAYIGLNFARVYPERICKLMLQQVAAFREAQTWAMRADLWGLIRSPWIGQLIMRSFNRVVANHWYHSALPTGHEEVEARKYAQPALNALALGGCFCLSDAYQALLSESHFTPAGIKQETNIIWGAADNTHSLTSHASLLQDLPKARFYEFSDCGHFPCLEQPELYYPLLREALA